jgi:2-polyprenyl-3-methyl-5-hydroxy-6-metoxy-1,4-benzoquinol methylase
MIDFNVQKMSEFEFKEVDREGMDTLNVIAEADKFNEWMYSTIMPYTKDNVLEIGSGIGNISAFFIRDGASICLSDIRDNYCHYLTKRFSKERSVTGILKMDLVDKDFDNKFSYLFNSFDSIFALNVVEHIADDDLAIRNCKKLLKLGGNLIILVPAYQWLFNKFDKELEHYRRYTKKTLKKLIGNYLEVTHSRYFNSPGILGWFLSGSILQKKVIPSSQMRLYNKLVPLFKLADKATFNQVGLSVIVVGRKTHDKD